ncbi:MAG TPA: sigma-70 family RNA polymerase sigma factor [Candidatus Limnocylindrales bacterium]|jgi:RNA polymerase sigma-70 factor (ECF subfamily)
MAIATTDPLCLRLADDLDQAFPELVTDHQGLVFGVAVRVVGDSNAEDVAQEVFVRAYRALKRYPAARVREMRLRPWLARMTLNQARNALRGRRDHVDIADVAESRQSNEPGPAQLVQRAEEQSMWRRMLDGLPARYRLTVALRHVDELSYAEIAETLGRPLGSVKSDVHRGIALLRAAYDAEQRATSQEAV